MDMRTVFSLSQFFSSFAVLIPHTRVLEEEENLNYLIVRHFFAFFRQFSVPIGLVPPFSVITTSIFSSCKRQLSDWNLYSCICNTRKKLQLNLSIFSALIFGCYSWTLALIHASRALWRKSENGKSHKGHEMAQFNTPCNRTWKSNYPRPWNLTSPTPQQSHGNCN